MEKKIEWKISSSAKLNISKYDLDEESIFECLNAPNDPIYIEYENKRREDLLKEYGESIKQDLDLDLEIYNNFRNNIKFSINDNILNVNANYTINAPYDYNKIDIIDLYIIVHHIYHIFVHVQIEKKIKDKTHIFNVDTSKRVDMLIDLIKQQIVSLENDTTIYSYNKGWSEVTK